MSGLPFTDIDDAVLLTQESLIKRGAFLDLQTDLQDHVAVREMWKAKQSQFEGGHPWRFDAQIDHNHSAKAVGLYETDSSTDTDTHISGEIEPRHVNAHYIYDLHLPDFQRGSGAIVKLVKSKYTAMEVSFFEYLEEVLWGKPDDSTDKKTPYGIAYWILKADTSGDEGFQDHNPSGFTAGRAGIDTSVYTRWANWAADYTAVSKEDLVRKMRKAARKTKFRSPVSHSQPELGGDMKNGIYTNDSVLGILEEVLETQNMNLGEDLDSKGGRTLFKGRPVMYAPYLDNSTDNPIYMLDWKWLTIGVLPGWQNNLGAPYMVPGKHLVRRVDRDVTLNMVCTNLRRQAVFSIVT